MTANLTLSIGGRSSYEKVNDTEQPVLEEDPRSAHKRRLGYAAAAALCVSAGALGLVSYSRSSPEFTLYVIRHAERYSQGGYAPGVKRHACAPPIDPPLPAKFLQCESTDGFDGNACGGGSGGFLTEEGLARARCVAARAANGTLFGRGPPRRVWSQWPGHCDSASVKREYQTVLPLALRFGVGIETHYETPSVRNATHSEKARISRIALREATARLFGDDVLQSGATTMCGGWGAISWDHGDLVNLFAALGCDAGVCRDHWPAGEFDAMARLTFSCTRPARFRRVDVVRQHCDHPELLRPEDCVPNQC